MAPTSQADWGIAVPTALDDVRSKLRNSVLLSLATAGFGLAVVGLFVDTVTTPEMQLWRIWSAIFFTWGVALFALGVVLYGLIRWERQ